MTLDRSLLLVVSATPIPPESKSYRKSLRQDPCSYCGGPAGTIDHIAADNDQDWMNLTSACRSCNSRKGSVPLLMHLAGISGVTWRSWKNHPDHWVDGVYSRRRKSLRPAA